MNQCGFIHKCIEATLGISLYSCLYPKLAKTVCRSYKKKKNEILVVWMKEVEDLNSCGVRGEPPLTR
jgi:hypothetical protein